MLLGIGTIRGDQPDPQKPVRVGIETVAEVGVVFDLGAAELHQYGLVDIIRFHLSQQFLHGFLALGRIRCGGLAGKLGR